jgi:nicotinamidase-related amidase
MSQNKLIEVDDSLLIVVDVQPSFLAKLPPSDAGPVLQRIGWLIGVANWLDIPIVATAEDIPREGRVDAHICYMLPLETPIYDKMVFDLTADATILAAVAGTQRHTAVLAGLETDVCVAQSALGLLGCGYRVAVVADAVAAPGTAHTFGLERMRQAGVVVLGTKSLFYEWVRTVERTRQFRSECASLGVPEGIRL